MDIKELREIGVKRIAVRISELEFKYQKLRESIWSGKEKNHAQLRFLKRDIARAKTILKEKSSAEKVKS
jgi:ribosomal protein L29